jgi:hypothetical protein
MDALKQNKQVSAGGGKPGTSTKGKKKDGKKVKTMKIAQSLSDMVYYVMSTSFENLEECKKAPFQAMHS